jgi:hypothetical protein
VITSNIATVLIATGALTASMLAQFVAPRWTLRHVFGEVPSGVVTIALTRHWGLLLFCVGALLIYARSTPSTRRASTGFGQVAVSGRSARRVCVSCLGSSKLAPADGSC